MTLLFLYALGWIIRILLKLFPRTEEDDEFGWLHKRGHIAARHHETTNDSAENHDKSDVAGHPFTPAPARTPVPLRFSPAGASVPSSWLHLSTPHAPFLSGGTGGAKGRAGGGERRRQNPKLRLEFHDDRLDSRHARILIEDAAVGASDARKSAHGVGHARPEARG